MDYTDIHLVINHFDDYIKDIDYDNLPAHDSEEYRTFILKTADEQIFPEGRYSRITEWTLELFDVEDVNLAVRDIYQINFLSDAERARLRFYLDLRDACFPLFRGKKIDWSAWPWNMSNGKTTMMNRDLTRFISKGEYVYLSAAICYDLMQQAFESGLFTSVALDEIAESYEYDIKEKWEHNCEKKELQDEMTEFIDNLGNMENHMLVGRQLGFDHLSQSVYDAMDTYITEIYLSNQVDCVREMTAWLKENWTLGEKNHPKEDFDMLDKKLTELMEKYNVKSPSMKYTWNILLDDVLCVPLVSRDDEDSDEDQWNDE